MKEMDLYKPLTIGLGAAAASITLESIDSISNSLSLVGRFLTAITMIITSIYTLTKLYQNAKQEKRAK
jgi:flagellar biogenesis protein FliO